MHLADACEVEAGEGRLHAGHSGCVHVTPADHAAPRHVLQHEQHAATGRVVNNLPPFKPILSTLFITHSNLSTVEVG